MQVTKADFKGNNSSDTLFWLQKITQSLND